LALEAAAEAAVFTFDWFKTKFSEAGNESSEEALTKAVQQAARAAVGVMEALPLFHQAIMEKASHPAVREVELYVISGFAGTHISLRRFPRLSRAVTRKQMLELLPEAVTTALNQRRAGEPLIRGRNSIRNRVARFLESWNKQPPRQENLYSPELLEKASRESPANNQPQMEIEDFELLQEARAKLAEKIAQSDLSPRERSVMDLKLQGHSQNEIASKLNITVGSVKRLQARAYKKLRS
jgi:RNA polymerase sigma factor (sigma-70 family)